MPLANHGFYSLTDESFKAQDVRYWPKADILSCTAHVRLWGKADIDSDKRDRFARIKTPALRPEYQHHSAQSDSAFGIGTSVRIFRRTAELGRRVFAQLKRAIHRDIRLRDNVNSDRFAREDL